MNYRHRFSISLSLVAGLFAAGWCFMSPGSARAATPMILNTTNATSMMAIYPIQLPSNYYHGYGSVYRDDNSPPSTWLSATDLNKYQVIQNVMLGVGQDWFIDQTILNAFSGGNGANTTSTFANGIYHLFEGEQFCNGQDTWQDCHNNIHPDNEWTITISNVLQPSLSFLVPVNSSTSPDFANWEVDIENATSGLLEIDYAPSWSAFFNASDSEQFVVGVSALPAIVPKQWLLAQLSTTTSWTAQANLWVNGTDYYSNIISFKILPSGSTYQPTYYQAFCNFTSSSFLADPVGNIQNAICNSFAYLFIPSPSQQTAVSNQFSDMKNAVATKPPFGYFTAIQSALYNASSAPSSSLVIVNASTAAAFSSILAPLNNLFSVILWILFAFWLFNVMRKIIL